MERTYDGWLLLFLLASCLSLLLPALVQAQGVTATVTFVWDANEEADLAGYRLYQSGVSGQYGETPRAEIPAGTETVDLEVPVPPGGATLHWVLTAYDRSDNESGHSNEVSYTFSDTSAPGAPGNLQRQVHEAMLRTVVNLAQADTGKRLRVIVRTDDLGGE